MPLALKTYPTIAEAGSALKDAGARYIGGGTTSVPPPPTRGASPRNLPRHCPLSPPSSERTEP